MDLKGTKIMLLLLVSMTISCFTYVKYRQFQGKEEYFKVIDNWEIATPMLKAVPGLSDRTKWNRHNYWTEIPIHYIGDKYNEKAEYYMKKGIIRIDTVYIYAYSKETCYVKSLATFDDGTPVFGYLQQYDHSPVSFAFDTLTIPQDEDSIRIDFTVRIKDTTDSDITETPFSFVLYRYDKKRLGMWGGK